MVEKEKRKRKKGRDGVGLVSDYYSVVVCRDTDGERDFKKRGGEAHVG